MRCHGRCTAASAQDDSGIFEIAVAYQRFIMGAQRIKEIDAGLTGCLEHCLCFFVSYRPGVPSVGSITKPHTSKTDSGDDKW